MDRFLIAGAALLLIFEVTFLVTGLDESSSRSNSFTRSEQSIGTLVEKKNSVHRRGTNTLIWDDTQKSDPLYAYDSVLTLNGSSANLVLNGETKLDLDQDTLVVLEPSGQASDGRLKIRFARGSMRAKNASKPLVISDEALQISTEPGTALHLAGLEDGRLHVEVEAGSARLESGGTTETVGSGDRLLLRGGVVEERTKSDQTLKWKSDLPRRVYADDDSVDVELAWDGEADTLRSMDPRRELGSRPAARERVKVNLGAGVTRFWLAKGDKTSETIEIDVRAVPTLRLFSPLPRDRFTNGKEVVFSWEAATDFKKYKLELSKSDSFAAVFRSVDVEVPRAVVKLDDDGTIYWRVKAIDELGLDVPPSKTSSFVVVPSIKLEAPTLNAPEIREPADDAPQPRDGARTIFDLLVPAAHAESKQVEAFLSWQPMNGAEYYMIEISATPGFESPLVNKKVTEPRFVHRGPRGAQVFWRVAAGAGDVVGPFSMAAVLKLEGVKALAQSEAPKPSPSPSPPLVVAKSAPVVVVTPVKPSEADWKTVETAKPEKSETKPEANPEPIAAATPVPMVPFAEKANRKLGRFTYAPQFRQTQSRNDLNVNGSFTGPVVLSFGLDAYVFESDNGRVELALGYESADWKPDGYPLQSSVREQRIGISVAYRSRFSPWAFAIATETLPLLTRVDADTAELQTQALHGFDARFTEALLLGVADFELAIRAGSGLVGGRLSGSLDYPLGASRYFLGPHLSYEAYSSENQRKLSSAAAGVHLGAGW